MRALINRQMDRQKDRRTTILLYQVLTQEVNKVTQLAIDNIKRQFFRKTFWKGLKSYNLCEKIVQVGQIAFSRVQL